MLVLHTKSDADGGPYTVTIKTSLGPMVPVFASEQVGAAYIRIQQAEHHLAVSPPESLLARNPRAVKSHQKVLFLNSPELVEKLLDDPKQFPYADHVTQLPEYAAPKVVKKRGLLGRLLGGD